MATHQNKRPYAGSQPRITSYFSRPVSPTSAHLQNYSMSPSRSVHRERPQLPADIQSNLLSVGMRVRKSVPEGYKTGSYSAYTQFSDNSAPLPMQTNLPRNRPRARELTPFCGILKVGGMAQPQWGICNSTRDSEVVIEDEEEDFVPSLSQGSTISSDSVATPGGRKRRIDFDIEPPEEQLGTSTERVNVLRLGERAMAVPRRQKAAIKISGVVDMGQENEDVDLDFGEADFLEFEFGDSDMSGV